MFRHEHTYLPTSTYLTTLQLFYNYVAHLNRILTMPDNSTPTHFQRLFICFFFTRSQRGIGQHHTVFRESSQSSVRQVRPQTQTEIAIYLGPPTKLRDSENTNICPAKKTENHMDSTIHGVSILVFSGHYSPLFDMSRRKKSKS